MKFDVWRWTSYPVAGFAFAMALCLAWLPKQDFDAVGALVKAAPATATLVAILCSYIVGMVVWQLSYLRASLLLSPFLRYVGEKSYGEYRVQVFQKKAPRSTVITSYAEFQAQLVLASERLTEGFGARILTKWLSSTLILALMSSSLAGFVAHLVALCLKRSDTVLRAELGAVGAIAALAVLFHFFGVVHMSASRLLARDLALALRVQELAASAGAAEPAPTT